MIHIHENEMNDELKKIVEHAVKTMWEEIDKEIFAMYRKYEILEKYREYEISKKTKKL